MMFEDGHTFGATTALFSTRLPRCVPGLSAVESCVTPDNHWRPTRKEAASQMVGLQMAAVFNGLESWSLCTCAESL